MAISDKFYSMYPRNITHPCWGSLNIIIQLSSTSRESVAAQAELDSTWFKFCFFLPLIIDTFN